jgi:hypothetical protein
MVASIIADVVRSLLQNKFRLPYVQNHCHRAMDSTPGQDRHKFPVKLWNYVVVVTSWPAGPQGLIQDMSWGCCCLMGPVHKASVTSALYTVQTS